ncbi:GNAT family N-acetyltransferase [Rhizobium sp. XQZ8]|uniref:GNAT family N-acetyltransferase n=1 Tax=Rhizobium populisoli TaxID=2859785 RepID=UPI001C675584|nr:GNAT family N-acetyltransferase [Rhizobium populisoli]MBW6424509.1 GNAT family N-acetyltransferase [Rhizobium populisoli]
MNAAVLQKASTRENVPGPCPVITTKRLVLRPHKLSDASAIAESLGDFKVARMLARVPQPYDLQDGLDWLVTQASGLLPDWTLAITTGDDVHIGMVGLEMRGARWRLGYWLNRLYWDRGYMTEAVAGTLERFFRRMPDTEIYSGAFADNLGSLNIQKKLGFRIVDANEIFSLSRNRMVPHIETMLLPEDFRTPGRP